MARSRGEGTIVKRSDGRYQGSLQVAGERRTVYGKTQKEVRQKLDALKEQARLSGGDTFPEKHTRGDLLTAWLDTGATRWAPRTAADHRRYADTILDDLNGSTQLLKLTPARLQTFINRHAARSIRTAQLLHQALHAAFTLAVRWNWLPVNPADKVERPRNHKEPRQWWTADECRTFLDATEKSRWWPLWAFALATGCRLGELSALRWTDIDPAQRTVRIERSGQHVGSEWREKSPKSAAGRRTLPLSDFALDALHRQRAQQAAWRLKAGPAWADNGLVFTTLDGHPLRRFDVAKTLRNAVRRLGLPAVTMHQLRHLAASLALQEGAPLPLVSRHLGHSSVGITASVYSHAVGNGAVVADAVGRALSRRA